MNAKRVVVQPGHGPVWNMSPGRSASLKLQNAATAASVRRLQRPPSSMDEHEIAKFFKRFGWETVGASPF